MGCELSKPPQPSSSIHVKFTEQPESPKLNASLTTQSPSPRRKMQRKDFLILGLLGKGAFGVVYRVMKKDTGCVYAMKEISKQVIINHNLESSSFLERNIMKRSDCPFLVKLRYAFQSTSKCYFVMEQLQDPINSQVSGGELYKITKQSGPLSEGAAKFIVAEIVLALEYLHTKLKVIYRDLKPENILLTNKGHVKLTDFGLAAEINDQYNYTMAGTPEYLAPEIVSRAGHSFEVDLWALGVLIFELLAGHTPFSHPERNVKAIQDKIMQNRPVFSERISSSARNLISGLLKFNPKQRIGAKVLGPIKQSFDQLKKHQFFSGIDFEKLACLELKSPLEELTQRNANIEDQHSNRVSDKNQSPHTEAKILENFSYDPELEELK